MSLRPPIKRRLTVYAAPGPSSHNVRSPAFFGRAWTLPMLEMQQPPCRGDSGWSWPTI